MPEIVTTSAMPPMTPAAHGMAWNGSVRSGDYEVTAIGVA